MQGKNTVVSESAGMEIRFDLINVHLNTEPGLYRVKIVGYDC